MDQQASQLNSLAEEIYTTLAAQFPVCLSSDEFHFFPQFKATPSGGSAWDDFSIDAVNRFYTHEAQWQIQLDQLKPKLPDSTLSVDIDLLSRVLTTIKEQLKRIRLHQTQPSFYLTIISIGLAEALAESREALERRITTLPQFFASAMANLKQVPAVFVEVAKEVIPELKQWVSILPLTNDERLSTIKIFDKYDDHLGRIEIQPEFRLQRDLYARIADHHMGCQMELEEVAWHLDQEIEMSEQNLVESAGRICADKSWQAVFHDLPSPVATNGDIEALYFGSIAQLKRHCIEQGFFNEDMIADCDVVIQTIPEHMIPVRANAAYSMPPGHPPKGGVFYILPLKRQSAPQDIMLLAAHETFPGHHLLDTSRWRLECPLRRCLEFPLFYEGWASFSEEILFDTEFFSGSADQLLMAKRRYWRACRGRADFRIHTGRCSLDEAATELAEIGLVSYEQALAMVRRYALKPGYQLSYAIGRRKFRQIYAACLGRGNSPAQFVRDVLSCGEIGFDHLAERLLYTT